MIIVRSPLRISYFGGGTDLPSWYKNNKKGGAVIASAINKYSYINIRYLEKFYDHNFRVRYYRNEEKLNISNIDHPIVKIILQKYYKNTKGLEIIHNADLPARSGLGSSSSFTNCLLKSVYELQKKKIPNELLWKKSLEIEQQVDGNGVGSQDQITTAIGGTNYIRFKKNKINIQKFKNLKNIEYFKDHCSLYFLGFVRDAKNIEKDKIKNIKNRSEIYNELLTLCFEAKKLFEKKNILNLNEIGELMRNQWALKKHLSNKVSNTKINQLYNFGLKSGAIGGKILGAGGGGFFIFLSKNKKEKKKLINKIDKIKVIDFKFDTEGTKVIYNNKF